MKVEVSEFRHKQIQKSPSQPAKPPKLLVWVTRHLLYCKVKYLRENADEAKLWMIDNQEGRRDLEPYERCELEFARQELYESRQGKRNDLENVNESLRTSSPRGDEVQEEHKKPVHQAAEGAGVGPRTYDRALYIHKHGSGSERVKCHGAISIAS